MIDTGNATIASSVAPFAATLDDEFDTFDSLPKPVRDYLNDAPVRFSAVNMVEVFTRRRLERDPANAANNMLVAEAVERDAFNRDHRERYGTDLPHVMAGVTPLRAVPANAWTSSR